MKDKIKIILFLTIIYIVPLIIFIKKDTLLSYTERRVLITKEELKKNPLNNIENYLKDQFPKRDKLINISSIYKRYILKNYETNNAYLYKNVIIEKNYPLNTQNINNFITNINKINKTYFKNNNKLLLIIPDKSYYLSNKNYLKIDFNYLELLLNKIEINHKFLNNLTLNDYYKTDIHLKQSSYLKILKEINPKFQNINYTKKVLKDFKGSSYSKIPVVKSEELEYLTNNIIENSIVTHFEYPNIKNVYNLENYNKLDPYSIFLNGPSALIEIETQNDSNKELIIFRDSYASSLTPLLLPYYKKITLIDLRYITLKEALKRVETINKDILYIYGTEIINNSNVLKINFE